MARLLSVSYDAVYRWEHGPHRCPRPAVILVLRSRLCDPVFVARLAAVGYPHPFPEDLGGETP